MTIHEVIRRPLVTEKGVAKKDNERTLCFEVAPDANKTQVKQAVEKLFKVKVAEVRTANFEGKLRRRGRFIGLSPGLEEGLREVEGRAEGARLRGDLNPCRSRLIRPITPTRRFQTVTTRDDITKDRPEKSLVDSKKRTGGRNSTGRVTSRFIGGGAQAGIPDDRFQAR